MTDLKPCPFCADPAPYIGFCYAADGREFHTVECRWGACRGQVTAIREEDAVDRWNRRTGE